MLGTRVLIVDPHQLSREGLRLLLAGETCEVISATTTLEAALLALDDGAPPGLLIWVLAEAQPGESVAGAMLQRIRASAPHCKLVLLAPPGGAVSSGLLAAAAEWGASALLRGDVSMDVLVRSLHLVMLGQEIFPAAAAPPSPAGACPADAGPGAVPRPLRRLSERESLILRYLLSGHSNKMIARALAISAATVKVHMKAVLRKLNVSNRTQAAMWAAANGFADAGAPPASPASQGVELAA